jgi:hypothetical protein
MEFRRRPDLFERGLQAASSRDNRPRSRTHYEAVIKMNDGSMIEPQVASPQETQCP